MRRSAPTSLFARRLRAFTLAEVLAALMFMAIVIPVVMQGVSSVSRAGILGQRKAAAMRIAERVLDELLATNQIATSTGGGTITEGDTDYPWTVRTDPWSEDGTMNVATARVTFVVRGGTFEVATSTLYDPTGSITTGGSF